MAFNNPGRSPALNQQPNNPTNRRLSYLAVTHACQRFAPAPFVARAPHPSSTRPQPAAAIPSSLLGAPAKVAPTQDSLPFQQHPTFPLFNRTHLGNTMPAAMKAFLMTMSNAYSEPVHREG